MTSHCITWHDTTQAITSHQMTWPSHDLTPQQTSRHQNTSLQSTKHHHHGTAEGSFTAKKWFGHRAGRSPCAHSIGKFFLCYIVLFLLETSAPGLSGYYWYDICILLPPCAVLERTNTCNIQPSNFAFKIVQLYITYTHIAYTVHVVFPPKKRACTESQGLYFCPFWQSTLSTLLYGKLVSACQMSHY